MNLAIRWGMAMVAAILLGLLLALGAASARAADNSSIQLVQCVQFPRDTTGDGYRASGALAISGNGVLCPDYSYSGVRWADPGSVEYWINTTGSSLPVSTAISSITSAFDTWDNACVPLSFSYQGATSLEAGSKDSKNVVSWGDLSQDPGAIAMTYYWYDHGNHIIEADTLMSTSFDWSYTAPNVTHDLSGVSTPDASRYADPTNSGVADKYDVRSIMTHEVGHWLCLNDLYGYSQDGLTMYGYGDTGELKEGTLAYGDELGVESVYEPRQITLNTTGLVSTRPVTVHYRQEGVDRTATTWGTWSSAVDDGSAVSIDSEVAVSSTERYSTLADTSWNAIQSATYTVSYYHQYKSDISAVAAGTSHVDLDATNCATLTYRQYGSSKTLDIFDGQSFSDWMDAGSTGSLHNTSSGSTSSRRWYASGAGSWVVIGARLDSVAYWEQLKPTISVTTDGKGHSDLDAENPATLTYEQCGCRVTFDLFNGQSFNDWVDAGSDASLSHLSSASTSTHRWQTSGTPSWVVNDAGFRSASYLEQYRVTVAPIGLDESRPANLRIVQNGTTNDVPASGIWSDWVEVGSTVSIDDSIVVSASEWYVTADTHSWTTDSAVNSRVSYSHQFLTTIGVAGLGLSRPTTVSFVQDGVTSNATVSETWSDWTDANSSLSIRRSVEGGWIGDWSTDDIANWTVDAPISASLSYHRTYVGPYFLTAGLLAGAIMVSAGMIYLLRVRRKGYALHDLPEYPSDGFVS